MEKLNDTASDIEMLLNEEKKAVSYLSEVNHISQHPTQVKKKRKVKQSNYGSNIKGRDSLNIPEGLRQ